MVGRANGNGGKRRRLHLTAAAVAVVGAAGAWDGRGGGLRRRQRHLQLVTKKVVNNNGGGGWCCHLSPRGWCLGWSDFVSQLSLDKSLKAENLEKTQKGISVVTCILVPRFNYFHSLDVLNVIRLNRTEETDFALLSPAMA